MALQIYNSLSKKMEVFKPIEPDRVKVYHCGPTVYKRQHIGNMRRYLFADTLNRILKYLNYEVDDVMNVTDVGHLTLDDLDEGVDKLEEEAKQRSSSPKIIAQEQTKLFLSDLRALNIPKPNRLVVATEHIAEMQELIGSLLDKGLAYQTKSGVYFDVQKFSGYGKLSGNSWDKLEAGARIEVRGEKKQAHDFALWKTDDPDHIQMWDSPWGKGYPGWHIECSAMSMKYLGQTLDIHTGGQDNKFPHHENEIAQSEGATGQEFARYWLHNAWLVVNGEKLAKRSGRQITLDSLRERNISPLTLRLFVLGASYRTPIDFSWEALETANDSLERMRQLVRRINESELRETAALSPIQNNFRAALENDLNTSAGLALMFDLVTEINSKLDAGEDISSEWSTLLDMDQVIGIWEVLVEEIGWENVPPEIIKLAELRLVAKRDKDFKKSDELRQKIMEAGFRIEDKGKSYRLIPIASEKQ